jgi:hypothetical protein
VSNQEENKAYQLALSVLAYSQQYVLSVITPRSSKVLIFENLFRLHEAF